MNGGDWTNVIQPELRWNSTSGFYIVTESFDNPEYYNLDDFSTQENVSTGDALTCKVTQIASNEWDLSINDDTSGAHTSMHWYPGTGSNWGPYTWAQMAVYETYVSACDGLFRSNQEFVIPYSLEQAGPNWNSFNDVLPLVSPGAGWSSQCGFDAIWSPWSSGDPYSYFSWSY